MGEPLSLTQMNDLDTADEAVSPLPTRHQLHNPAARKEEPEQKDGRKEREASKETPAKPTSTTPPLKERPEPTSNPRPPPAASPSSPSPSSSSTYSPRQPINLYPEVRANRGKPRPPKPAEVATPPIAAKSTAMVSTRPSSPKSAHPELESKVGGERETAVLPGQSVAADPTAPAHIPRLTSSSASSDTSTPLPSVPTVAAVIGTSTSSDSEGPLSSTVTTTSASNTATQSTSQPSKELQQGVDPPREGGGGIKSRVQLPADIVISSSSTDSEVEGLPSSTSTTAGKVAMATRAPPIKEGTVTVHV